MTADRTDELIRSMLERRAGHEAPPGLVDRTLDAVRGTQRVNGGAIRAPAPVRPPTSWSAIVTIASLVILAALGGVWVGGTWRAPVTPSQPAGGVLPTERASVTATPSGPPPPSPTPGTTDTPWPDPPDDPAALGPRTIAVVTKSGHHLRVRSAPRVADDSVLLDPTLAAGQRMLVLDGPVQANGYDWWEVLTYGDVELYGWVAGGKDGTAWIERVALDCPAAPDASTVAQRPEPEVLACYGGRPITVAATRGDYPPPAETFDCEGTFGVAGCVLALGWLQAPGMPLTLKPADGERYEVPAAERPDSTYWLAVDGFADLDIALDAPEARDCRVTDPASGAEVIPAGRSVAECRLTYVIQDAAS